MGRKITAVLAVLALLGLACSLPAAPSSGTPTASQTLFALSVTPPVETPAAPTGTLSPANTVPPAAPTAPSAPTAPANTRYAVVLVAEGDALNVRQVPGANAPLVGQLAFDARDIPAAGGVQFVGGQTWVEVRLSSGQTGWANALYLTEQAASAEFCADPDVPALVDSLRGALINNDGELLSRLVSPVHGLTVRYFPNGSAINYTPEQARWLFSSTFAADWGAHPASGEQVRAPFHQEVLPRLLDVFAAENRQPRCGELNMGPTSMVYAWPVEYRAVNFIGVQRPGTSANGGLDWRTWLVGIEYVGGIPYLFSLEHLFWTP